MAARTGTEVDRDASVPKRARRPKPAKLQQFAALRGWSRKAERALVTGTDRRPGSAPTMTPRCEYEGERIDLVFTSAAATPTLRQRVDTGIRKAAVKVGLDPSHLGTHTGRRVGRYQSLRHGRLRSGGCRQLCRAR